MAQRRMFSKKIVETDLFNDMPVTAKYLYFYLNMEADDDGFVGNPKTIKMISGATDDDFKILIAKKYIIPFESGVIVIKDWLVHNYIRPDTYSKTVYKDELDQLSKDSNKAYILELQDPSTGRIRDVDDPSTQDRLGQDRIGKDKIDKDSQNQEKDDSDSEIHNLQFIINFYQNDCGFGLISPNKLEQLRELYTEAENKDLIIEAMKAADNYNAKSPIDYMSRILKTWEREGVKTIADVEALRLKKQSDKSKANYSSIREKVIQAPEWSNPDYHEEMTDEELEAFKKQLKSIEGVT